MSLTADSLKYQDAAIEDARSDEASPEDETLDVCYADSGAIEQHLNHQEEIHPVVVSHSVRTEYWSKGATVFYCVLKRVFDILISLLAIVILFIPCVICCIAIAVDSKGSPIYRQLRVGKNGKPLIIFKLRTMYSDAGDLDKYLTPEQQAEWHRSHKIDHDSRITKVGRFLRRTSFDEVPQFLNVLLGQMSVVGPRPVEEEEVEAYGDYRDLFLSALPGVTGFWQVYARDQTEYQSGGRQAMELFYVRNRSLALDAKLFFLTFAAIFKRTGQ
jgi:lipopolysaccharide/colanic/teichoic acid biosynthesis glycosyltransferase